MMIKTANLGGNMKQIRSNEGHNPGYAIDLKGKINFEAGR